jgi:hypothetical protein
MIILVSDTSILIDLERGGLLEASFSCGLTMVVPDLLYERELEPENGALLRKLGLGVVSLTPEEVALAQRLRTERKALSLPDCFALSCATRADHALVTGDKILRTEAMARLGNVYGLLWMLDQMAASGSVPTTLLYEGLARISAHPRCRLPQSEVRSRLNAWVSV